MAASVASSGEVLTSPSFCLHSVGPGSAGLASTAAGLASAAVGLAGDRAGLSERLPSSAGVSGSRLGSATAAGLTEGKQG